MKILLTGSSGFIGSSLLERLRTKHDVIAPTYTELDLNTRFDMTNIPNDIDVIIHLASGSLEINAIATRDLRIWGNRIGARFVYASSGGVQHWPNTHDDYVISKDYGEEYTKCDGTNWMILRYFFPYGPTQKLPRLIPRLIDSIRNGKPISVVGGGPYLNPIFVEDCIEYTTRLISKPKAWNKTWNVAGDEIVNVYELATLIGNELGIGPYFEWEGTPQESTVGWMEPTKRITEYEPSWTLRKGIEELIKKQENH